MNIREIVAHALAEDCGTGDVTTKALFPANVPASGTMIAEEPEGLVVAGLAVAVEVFSHVDTSLECTTHFADGDRIRAGATVLTVTGDGRSMLQGERVALNFLRRGEGVQDQNRRYPEDDAWPAGLGKMGGDARRRLESSAEPGGRHPDQGQPSGAGGRRRSAGLPPGPGTGPAWPENRSRSPVVRRRESRPR